MKNTKEITSMEQLKAVLAYSIGTEGYYHRQNTKCVYTDGIMEYLEHAKAHWVYDIIESEMVQHVPKDEPGMTFLTLTVKDKKADMSLAIDQGEPPLWKKHIPLTNHVEGEIMFYVSYDGNRTVIYLPSEH